MRESRSLKPPAPRLLRGRRPSLLRRSPPLLLAAALLALAVCFAHAAPAASAQQAVEPPGAVTGLELTATAGSVTVRWSAPESGGAPNGYIVHIRPEDGGVGSGRTKTPRAKKTEVTFERLEAGTTYQVWVRARNAAGKGERVRAAITLPVADALPDSYERPLEVINCYDLFSAAYCDSFR